MVRFMTTVTSAMAGLLLLTCSVRADGLSFDLDSGEDVKTSDRTIVLVSADEVQMRGISGVGASDVQNAVRDVLKDQPEGTRARVVIGQGTEGSVRWTYVYPRSVVALDDEDRPHGVERLVMDAMQYRQNYRMVPWRHGQRHGVEKEYVQQQMVVEIPWVDGRMHGTRKTYFANGDIQSETEYANGVASGPTRTWDREGSLIMEGRHEDGNRHGVFSEYWPGTTQPQRQITYRHGVVDGTVREYYPSGKLRRERTFVDEALHGPDRMYLEDGDVFQTRYWFRGEPVTEEEFHTRATSHTDQ